MSSIYWILITGLAFGVGAVLLVKFGNPGNYGFCAACHLRDIAGALGIHKIAALQYARPEIMGWVLGAFTFSITRGEFQPRGGSKPVVRFLLGIVMMLGALVFLGCPLRAILRLSAGDLNGITGLIGFAGGIGAGIWFLQSGYNLGRSRLHGGTVRYIGYLPVIIAVVLIVGVAVHASYLQFSLKGPGSQHAPLLISLVAGLITGLLAARMRMCLSGGVRDYLLVRDTFLLKVYGVMFISAVAANMYFGFFKLGFTGQPLAHSMHIWNFLSLFAVGLAATLAGGCPLRQLILSAQGSTDAMFCVLGMLAGAGLAHGLNLAASGNGVGAAGQIAVIIAIGLTAGVGFTYREQIGAAKESM